MWLNILMSKTEMASDQNLPKDNSEQLTKPIIPNQPDLHETSLPPGAPSSSSKAILSDGGVAEATPTAEKRVLGSGGVPGETGILGNSGNSGKRNHKKTISRFALLGIFNTVLDFFIFNMLRVVTHTPSSQINKVILLNILSATTVATLSFFISRSFVFEQKDTKTHMIIPFIATNLFGIFVLQSLVIKLLLGPLESPAEYLQNLASVWNLPLIQNFTINFFDTNLAKAFATIVTLVWNYTIYNFVIFKFKPTKPVEKS